MQKDVTQGKSYCLTVYSVPCKVTAIGENNIEYTLLNVSETGQYLFIAPTWKVNISQDDASIVETFNLAGTGKVGGSGSGSDPTYGFLKIIFVDALPPISEAKENTLYFVPKNGSAPDNYDEYIFDPVNQQFELVGQSAIDTFDFAKLSSTNIFLAPNTFNNEIRVPTIAGLTSTPIKVTSAVNFTSNSDTNFSGNINTPNINVTDLVTIASSKIQTNDLGEFTIGQNIQTPTTANNGAHKFMAIDVEKRGIALAHKVVKNGRWAYGWVILTDRWDFTYHSEAFLQVKEPKTDKEAANKLYVDTSLNSKANSADVYTKTECDGKFATVASLNVVKTTADNAAPQSTTYTKTESDGKYATKTEVTAIKTTADAAAPQATTYTKTEVDTSLSSKANSADVYTKTESDNKYATKTEVATIKTTADAAAPQATTYTKTECDGKFALLTTAYTKAESDNKYALKTDQSITSTSDKVQICNTSQQVANASAITVVNGGLIFQTDGKVFIGVNGAWVQLGVPIS